MIQGLEEVLIDSLGNFRKIDSYNLLKDILQDDNADPYERYSAAVAISKTGHPESYSLLKRMIDSNSYHNLVARGAIEGLKIISINSEDKHIKKDVEDFIIEKTKHITESRLRRNIASVLGYLGRYTKDKSKIIELLKKLQHDESFYVRNTACVAIANALERTNDPTAIEDMKKIMEEDSNSLVRETASVCINIIKGEDRNKEEISDIAKEETKFDSNYKSQKFDLLENVVMYN